MDRSAATAAAPAAGGGGGPADAGVRSSVSAMEPEGAPPLCSSCNHPHWPDIKCAVCGHKGKGKSYLLIAKTTAPSSSTLHFECFDARGDAQVFKTRTALARILRGRVFVEECGVPDAQEFDAHDEASRHVIGLVGDAPVVYARWRLEESGAGTGTGGFEGALVAVIDRLAILPSHRGRGYASRALEFLLEDVAETARGLQRWVGGVAATVPVPMQQMGQKLEVKYGFEVLGAPYPDRNTTFVRMLRRTAPTAAAPPGT